MTNLNLTSTAKFRSRPMRGDDLLPMPTLDKMVPVYDGGRLVGHYGLTWNNAGRLVRVFIPGRE